MNPSSVELVWRLCDTVNRKKQRNDDFGSILWAEQVRDEEAKKLSARVLNYAFQELIYIRLSDICEARS